MNLSALLILLAPLLQLHFEMEAFIIITFCPAM